MKERVILTIGGGEIEAWLAAVRGLLEYCKAQGYDAKIRNGQQGHEIYVIEPDLPASKP